MTTTTAKQPTQQKQTVQQAAALLQDNFDKHARHIGSKDTSGRLFDTDNTPTRTDAPLVKEA